MLLPLVPTRADSWRICLLPLGSRYGSAARQNSRSTALLQTKACGSYRSRKTCSTCFLRGCLLYLQLLERPAIRTSLAHWFLTDDALRFRAPPGRPRSSTRIFSTRFKASTSCCWCLIKLAIWRSVFPVIIARAIIPGDPGELVRLILRCIQLSLIHI